MALLEKHLLIKKSQLPNAGKGLFTKVDISKGTRIVEYKGRIQTWREVKHEDGYNPYLFRVNGQTVINGLNHKKAYARYINDAAGITRVKGLQNNTWFVIDGRKCFVEAKRKIYKGEEIFAAYGSEFWKLVRKIYHL
jgi:hypothetical protein